MIDMDRQRAFAVLGLPNDASSDEIEALVNDRRRKLRQSIVFATTAEQRQSSERALAELESAHVVVTLPADDSDSSLPNGSKIMLPAGATLGDRYVVRRRIGFGESGAVFAALDLTWGKEVALKVIRPELLLVPGTYERLEKAVQAVSELAHSGVVSVYGLSKVDGHVMVASELLAQQNLRVLLQDAPKSTGPGRRSGLTIGHIIDIVQALCTALNYARSKTLHLNLKPDNVIISDDGFVKLTDFGLDSILGPALQITSPTAREQRRYRAPEQARQSETGSQGRTPIDERADQFSVAAIAHYLLLSAAPYPDPSPMALRQMGVAKLMADVLSRALSSDPRERFASVADFSTAFSKASRKRITIQVVASTIGALAIGALLLTGTSIVTGRDNPVSDFVASIVKSIPGFDTASPQNIEVAALQSKVLALTTELTGVQNKLRRAAIENRIERRSKAQAIDLAETDTERADAERDFAVADLSYRRIVALRDVANPDIFNNPETLNAINLLGLANDHIREGHPLAARSVLTRAEAVLLDKLRDYEQAESMVLERVSDISSTDDPVNSAPVVVQTEQFRRDWRSASQTRRRFAAEVQARMIAIPRGSFDMGDRSGLGNQTEQPVRTVLVPSFQLSAFEVTVEEYQKCVVDGPCSANATTLSAGSPATGLSWFDTQNYLTWISRETGDEYRLPTEAEWEYAARANGNGLYPWGAHVGNGLANCINCGSPWERVGPAPVASFAPNAFGLYDMAGNVWEWTADCWYPNYSGAPAIAIAR
ncbi:MAG: SUMF1/EgtB/PvdO family nonheme iron enzyme, partial [Rhodospirillaceae bacterium]|nr:SUMF1/EgtB/PvdO family nonheme iron enzyme [Rhodospirillaceae bacterium]